MSDARTKLAAFIRWVMRDTVYHRVTLATVAAPSSGKTVDLIPEDPTFAGPGLQGVPVVYGMPGVEAQFTPGTKMFLFFANGDPRKPHAIGFFDGTALSISFAGGQLGIARVGDPVTVTDPISGPLTGMIIGGSPLVKSG